MKTCLTLFAMLVLCRCHTPDGSQQPQNGTNDSTGNNGVQTATVSDTVIVSTRCAVFYTPDSTLLEKRMPEAEKEEAEFRAGMDDYLYALHEADQFLEEMKLQEVFTDGKPYIKFTGENGQVTLIKTDTLQELWGIYFFDPKQLPKAIDITVIEEEYKAYFK